MSASSVKLVDATTAAVCGVAPLDHLTAGYIVLEAAQRIREIGGGAVDAEHVTLDASGSVALSGKVPRGDEARSTRALRALLDGLLQITPSSTPGLRLAACRPEATGLALLVRELEGALAPIDRASYKQLVAKLAKATRDAALGGELSLPSSSAKTPSPPPVAAVAPSAPLRSEARSEEDTRDLDRERAKVRDLERKLGDLRAELTAVHDASVAAITDAEQSADRRIAEVVRARDAALAAADARVAQAAKERDAALSAARMSASAVGPDRQAELDAVRAQLELASDRRAAELARERDEAVALARESAERRVSEIARARDLAVATARQDAERKVSEAERARDAVVAELDTRIAELRGEHASSVEALRAEHDLALASARSERDALLAAARNERERALEEARRERDRRLGELEARMREAQAAHEQAIEELGKEHREALADAETRRARQLEDTAVRLRKVLQAEREAALVDLRHSHEVALTTLRSEHEVERSALRVRLYDLEHELARACADRDAERTLRVDAEAAAAKRVRELRRSITRAAPEAPEAPPAHAPVSQYWPMSEPPKAEPAPSSREIKENVERYRAAREVDSPPPPSPTGRRLRSSIQIGEAAPRNAAPSIPPIPAVVDTPRRDSDAGPAPKTRSTASLLTTCAVVGSLAVTVIMTCRGSGAIAALFAPPPPDMSKPAAAPKPAPSTFGAAPKVCEATLTLEATRADTEVLRRLGKAPFAVTVPMHVPLELVATLDGGAARRVHVDASASWRSDTVVPQLPLPITIEPLGDKHWPARTSSMAWKTAGDPPRGLLDITTAPSGATVWLSVDPAGIAVPCGAPVDLMVVPHMGAPKPIRIEWSAFRGSPARASLKL